MKKLINLPVASHLFNNGFNADYRQISDFLRHHKMDGLEIILYGDYDLDVMDRQLVTGHHLLYWPNWLDFWHGDETRLLEAFGEMKNVHSYYGFEDRQGMLEYYRTEFEIAKRLEVEYMVFHVSNVGFSEVFSFEHHYDDHAVMEACIELINEVFDGDGPLLLFENLWWPGLHYRDVNKVNWFMDQIAYKNKGLLLDVAHLLATSKEVDEAGKGIDFVHQVLDDMGGLASHIRGMHLSKSLPGPYLVEDHQDKLTAYHETDNLMERFGLIYNHIKQIDTHKPFDHPRIMEIIDRIKPDYLVYEFMARDVVELSEMIKLQQAYIKQTD